ncbi:MaoC/PaaZ C-terminal domain-containing protein [Desulfobacula sp.]
MKNDQDIRQIPLTGPETLLEIKAHPFMGFIFLKALMLSFFRSNTIADDALVNKTRIILNSYVPDKNLISNYRKVCSFSENRPDLIPISYLQTLFIGLLGKFITSPFFPISPLGLIHIFQSFEQKRSVAVDEILDLACTLDSIKKTQKGIETCFTLEVMSKGRLVWQGISIFFTRNPIKKRTPSKKIQEDFLEKKETIRVPSGTGRKYAGVSGDYNPHHLYTVLAKLFGFKKAIAHGMWSLARVVASLDKEFGIHDFAMVEAAFKLPIFMPATTTLGYENQYDPKNQDTTIVRFELRDKQKELPHLKGRLFKTI